MTYIITSPCVDVLDKSCVDVCPVDCIYHDEGTDRMLYIAPDESIDCAACEPVCPVTATFAEDDVPGGEAEFIPINYEWFDDREAARAKVDSVQPRG